MTKMVRIQISNAHKKSWMERCNWSCKLEDIIENLVNGENDIVVFLGAGNIHKIAYQTFQLCQIN